MTVDKKINKDVGRKWVKALRSGEFAQTKGRLGRIEDEAAGTKSYCCLGVLCELAVEEGIVQRSLAYDSVLEFSDGEDSDDMFPTAKVREWIGMTEWSVNKPEYDPEWDGECDGDDEVELSTLNDDRGLSFSEIADLIESSYELAEVTV